MDVLPVAIPVNSNDTSDDAAWRDAKPTFGTFNFFREEYLDSRRTRKRERESESTHGIVNVCRLGRGNPLLNGKTIPPIYPRGATKQLGVVMSSISRREG